MRQLVIFILLFLFLQDFGFSQNFGCYDIVEPCRNDVFDYTYAREGVCDMFYDDVDWNDFALDSNTADGYYKKYFFNNSSCTQDVKMEGFVKNGLQEGIWKFNLDGHNFYIGSFINGKKEGIWKGIFINQKGDSICSAEIEFKNNLYDGISKYYYSNGRLCKIISYKNGLNNGLEIKYFVNDTTEVAYIEELKEYTNGKLNGKYLIYNFFSPFDTLTYGEYSFGKKNGRFTYNQYDRAKTIVDYVNDKVEGKVIKYYHY
ncbi:MAG TPA: hypothetical protein PLG05_08530 [Bacteroidales bacterium]|nr:hypothetical protein [Bacteroidales bacterium]